jgi:endonuclease YncB( thermonuclease family)
MTTFSQAFLLVFLLLVPAIVQNFSAKVVSITDGDTLSVLHDGRPQRVRLNGIDCRERKQRSAHARGSSPAS